MQAEVFFTSHQFDEMFLRDKTVAVIDVLRASTTICQALMNGAKEVIPVTTVEAAMKIVGNLFGDVTLLGGERGGRKIEGFNLGNSPLEYTEERIRGKSIVFSSTNGSQALVKSRYAREMVVCGFINISPVASFLADPERDVTIVCSGRSGSFSMEDAVCAGMLLHMLAERIESVTYGDAGSAALALYKSFGKNVQKMINNSDHGMYLKQIGFGDDLKVCADVDAIPVLPHLSGNVIRLKALEKSSLAS